MCVCLVVVVTVMCVCVVCVRAGSTPIHVNDMIKPAHAISTLYQRYINAISLLQVRSPIDQGRTAVHEVGHYLNLNHIFYNTGGSCSDDSVGDTPSQESFTSGCPTCGPLFLPPSSSLPSPFLPPSSSPS